MSRSRPLPRAFYRRPANDVASDLLGRYLVRIVSGQRIVVRIVETEAYLGSVDRASHAWRGRRTSRNKALFQPGGVAYVYFIYGMHYCLNAVAGGADNGEAVLLRAAEPVHGAEKMIQNRALSRPPKAGDLAGGPGKLCRALQIDRQFDGWHLQTGPLKITEGEPVDRAEVVRGPRIGIGYAEDAVDWPLRYAIDGNPHVSRPFPWARRG